VRHVRVLADTHTVIELISTQVFVTSSKSNSAVIGGFIRDTSLCTFMIARLLTVHSYASDTHSLASLLFHHSLPRRFFAFDLGGAGAQWLRRWTCDQQVVGSNATRAKLRNNLGHAVVRTYVPLPPGSITWYRPRGGDALRLGR